MIGDAEKRDVAGADRERLNAECGRAAGRNRFDDALGGAVGDVTSAVLTVDVAEGERRRLESGGVILRKNGRPDRTKKKSHNRPHLVHRREDNVLQVPKRYRSVKGTRNLKSRKIRL